MKRIICIWLALLLTAASLWSCGGNETSETTATADTSAQEVGTEEPAYTPTVQDFGGASFTILHPSERYYDIAEESTGEIVNDAIFARDMMIAEQYNIQFVHEQETDSHANRKIYNDKIRGVVMSNDPVYDLVYGIEICTTETFTEGLYYNLLDFDEMLLNEIWWCPGQKETFSIQGKLFGAFGLSTLDLYKEAGVIFANSKLITDYGLDNPSQAVLDGEWTLDKMLSMSELATHDLDGDNNHTFGEDITGIIIRLANGRTFQTAFDIDIITQDENGMYKIADVSDRTATIIDTVKTFHESNKGAIICNNYDNTSEHLQAFMADKALFLNERLKKSEELREMDSDYYVLPLPKYDTAQDHYYTQIATATTMALFPLSIGNPQMSAMVTEAMSYYGYMKVVPQYYESALKNKYMRDETNAQVLDAIFAHTVNDFTFVYPSAIGGSAMIHEIFYGCAFYNQEYASTIASNKTTWETNLANLYEAFAALDN